jgi:hypothetical protein
MTHVRVNLGNHEVKIPLALDKSAADNAVVALGRIMVLRGF